MNSDLKVHRSYDEQIAILRERGIAVSDESIALQGLRNLGYYKISGYAYPYRKSIYDSMADKVIRENEYISNITIEDIFNLVEFDFSLTAELRSALSSFETALRSLVAYVSGFAHPMIHMNIDFLHPKTSSEDHKKWITKFESDVRQARRQDFVVHHQKEYDGQMPIWVAIEVMQFGTLTYLFGMLPDKLREQIAAEFGIDSRKLFTNILENMRLLRNECSHQARVWNAAHGPTLNKIEKSLPERIDLHHLDSCPEAKIYMRIVLLISMLEEIIPNSVTKNNFKNLVKNFPSVPLLSPIEDMGFPQDWETLDFWN